MELRRRHIFGFAYILYYCALFLPDLATDLLLVSKIIKYISYILFLFCCFDKSYKTNKIVVLSGMIFISIGISFFTKDIYFAVFFLLIMSSSFGIDHRYIFKISFNTLLLLAITTVVLACGGLLEIVNTANNIYSHRLGWGFYHSNVLPAIIFYLIVYRFYIKSGEIKLYESAFWFALSVVVFITCRSRNSFVLSAVVVTICVLLRNKNLKKRFKKILEISLIKVIYEHSILILSLISLFLTLISGMNFRSVYLINRFFSGRFALAYLKMKLVGLHFINFMNGSDFSGVGFTLDNGYLYTILRYGIFFILIYVVLQKQFNRRFQYDNIKVFIFTIVTISNFIDNDLYSYGFLPFIFSVSCIKGLRLDHVAQLLKIKE